jgi:hypothetical protein
MATLKYPLVVLLLVSGVVGCDPYHRYPSYSRDRYERPDRSYEPYEEHRGRHHEHEHEHEDAD